MSDLPEYVLDRVFNAPRPLVWKAWTQPDLLARWYGPNVETVIHKFELKPGGVWLNEMKMSGMSDLSRMEFTEVVPEEKLVWHHSSTDANWDVISNPRMHDWPRVLLTTVTFDDRGDTTAVRLVWTPFNASSAEIDCFAQMMEGFGGGWESGYAIMDDLLAELQAQGSSG